MIELKYNTLNASELVSHFHENGSVFPDQFDEYEYASKLITNAKLIEAWNTDKLVALCAVYINNDKDKISFVSHLDTLSTYRRQGIGKMLINEVVKLSVNEGFQKIKLEVNKSNLIAQKFYNSLDFSTIEDHGDKLLLQKVIPLVAIQCFTYNQEAYVRDTLEGFVMQKTNFPFIAIVHDDASTDNTPNIIREYAEKYPDIIKPILETENQFSKNDGSLGKIVNGATIESGCKYVAMCEGDDYWTSSDKLQIQVDFLESHPEYSMCFHDVNIKAEKGRDWYDVFGKLEDKDYDAFEDIYHWCVPTCSILCRTIVIQTLPKNEKFKMGDNVVVLTCGRYGKIRCIPEKMGVYRLNPTSWIGGQSNLIQRYKYISHYYGLIEEFESCRNETMNGLLNNQYFQLLSILKRDGNHIEFERVKKEYLAYFGYFDSVAFNKYYYVDSVRNLSKKILGKNISAFISKIKG